MTLQEMTNKIENEVPIAFDKLLDNFDNYMVNDALTVGDRLEILQDWRKSLSKDEIKELSKWIDLFYYEKVKGEKS